MVRSGRGTTAAAVVAAGGLGLSLAALGLGAATLTGALGDRTGGNKRKRGSPLSPIGSGPSRIRVVIESFVSNYR